MIIFFDLDDTLYDRTQPFINAYADFFSCTDTEVMKQAYLFCTKRGDEVFLPSQRGEITMEEMYIYRYCHGFGDMGITISPEEALRFQQIYKSYQNKITPGDGVISALNYCKNHFENIGIITNGPIDHQHDKIAALGIGEYFDENLIIISQQVGIAKPDKRIYQIAEERTKKSSSDIVFVGDDFIRDIEPTAMLGWHSIWLNRHNAQPAKTYPNLLSISTMNELQTVLANI